VSVMENYCSYSCFAVGTFTFREFSKRRNDDNHQLEVPTRHLKSDLDLSKSRVVCLASTAAWEIFSAMPIGNGLSPPYSGPAGRALYVPAKHRRKGDIMRSSTYILKKMATRPFATFLASQK